MVSRRGWVLLLAVVLLAPSCTVLGEDPADAGKHGLDKQCKKVLAFFALQANTSAGQHGKGAYMGESSKKHENHLKVVLTSIRVNCPSVVPVVVSLHDVSNKTKAWLTSLGATVVKHELSVSEHVLKTAALKEWSWTKNMITAYLRLEVHLILQENRNLFNPALVDTQYVLWGDLDTIWLHDFDSCTLAKPTLASDADAGVTYYNASALAVVFDELTAYAIGKEYKFTALDSSLLDEFAGGVLTTLPPFFNWRPYWGVPPETQWTRDAGGQIYILHVHGPSLDKVVCVLEFVDLEGRGLGRPWPPEQKKRIVNVCAPSGGALAHHQMDMVLAILEFAYMNDKGRLYRATDDAYRTLLLLQR